MDSGRAGDDDVLVLPPLPADPLFVDAVDEAVAGSVDDLPDAQPRRRLAGNARDFASLYIRHRASFGLHARRFLYDPRDVEEVLQEAFLRLFLAMPELETELQALAYCRRTVTNLCIDRYRADQRRPRLVDLDAIDWDPSDEKSYEDPVLRAEDAAIVRQALALLSPMHRAALIKREIEEKPLPQIAAELGIPEESVKHLLYRARRALRRLLAGTSVEPGADLSNTELARLANERLARATLRSANVLIVLFVAAVTVVGALRATVNDQVRRGIDVGSVGTPLAGAGAPVRHAHPVSPRHRATHKPVRTAHESHTATATQKPLAAPSAPITSSHTETFTLRKPAKHDSSSSTSNQPDPGAGVVSKAYKVSGSIQPTGPVAIANQVRVNTSNASSTSVSQLSAPVGAGSFTLAQALIAPPDSTAVMQLTPSVQTPQGKSVQLPVGDVVTSLTLDASTVTYAVHVQAELAVGPVAGEPTTLTADLTYDTGLRHILAERVTVQGLSVTDPPSVPVAVTSAVADSGTSNPDSPGSPTGQSDLTSETTLSRQDDFPSRSSSQQNEGL